MNNMYGGALPSNPSSANASKYQTNLGRTKTKKWVQASVPNYDGDDWGNEYDDEPEPEPPLPNAAHQQTWSQPQHPSSLAPGLASRPLLPSESSWTPAGGRSISIPSQGQQQPAPSNRPGSLPAESDQSWQERRSFTTGTADAMRSPSPLAAAPTLTAATGAGPSGPSSAQGRAPQEAARATSPSGAPQSPAQRFPPRKSSMSHKDGPPNLATVGPLLQSSSNPASKPGSPSKASNQKPWMEARAASPQGPRSPPQTGKPLPFVRPADIYKRLEEEKERRSQDSGRPSLESVGAGAGDNRVGSPGARSDGSDGARRTSLGKDDAERDLSPRGPRSQAGLATVAERTSEYGLEDYLVDSGAVPPAGANASDAAEKAADSGPGSTSNAQHNLRLDTANAPSNTDKTAPASVPAPTTAMTSVAAAHAPASVTPQQGSGSEKKDNESSLPHPPAQHQPAPDDNSSVAESEGDDLRRFSTSPVLPDVSRMSSFGVDMFSSAFSNEEPQPPLAAISEQQRPPPAERGKVGSPLSQVQQSSPSPAASSSSATPAPGSHGADAVPPPLTGADRRAAATSSPAPDAAAAAQAIAKDRSDTPLSSASALSAAPQARESAASALPRPVDETDAVKPCAASLKDSAQSTNNQAGPAEKPTDSHADVKSSQVAAENMQRPGSSKEASRSSTPQDSVAAAPTPASSRSRSQSPSKVQAMVNAMNQANSKAAGVPRQSGKVSSSASSPVTTAPPAAPPELDALEPVTRTSTFTTTATASPVKESDKLREEIILSLSPQQGGGEFAGDKKLSAEAPSSGVPRESTYLGDVYDDYYGGPDDSTDEPISEKPEGDKADGAANDASSSAPMPKLGQGLGDVPPLNPTSMSPRPLSPRKSQPSVQIPALKHRFSWEMGAEEVTSPTAAKPPSPAPGTSPAAEAPEGQPTAREPDPKSLSIVSPAQPPAQSPSSLMVSPMSSANQSSEMSPVATGANISHSVSDASTLSPGKRLAAIELPSPLSVRSDEQTKSLQEALPILTLAEEKNLMTTTSSPVSPPPQDEHPAFSEAPAAATAPAKEENATSPTETTPTGTAPAETALELTTTAPTLTATAPTPTTETPAGREVPPQSPTAPAPTSPSIAKVVPFKEIMGLPTAAERIERLDESRDVFSKFDSGLVSWLVVMTQVPENSNASWSLRDNITNGMLGAGGQKTGAGAAHQPGSHAAGANGGGRPISGLVSGSQFTAADLRHSGKEVGAKGKELLMAGGKAAKGLFSKGKSKFRAFER